MNKFDLPVYLQNALDADGQALFLSAAKKAHQKGCSKAKCFIVGVTALQQAGYVKDASGKWKKENAVMVVKLEKVQKADSDKRQVFGFFSVVEHNGIPVVDSQGDVISATDIEKAIYKYVKVSRMGDDRHDGRCKAVLIESMFFSKEKQEMLGIDLGFVGWWGGFEVLDEVMWTKIKTGEYQSFSIGGQGRYEQYGV